MFFTSFYLNFIDLNYAYFNLYFNNNLYFHHFNIRKVSISSIFEYLMNFNFKNLIFQYNFLNSFKLTLRFLKNTMHRNWDRYHMKKNQNLTIWMDHKIFFFLFCDFYSASDLCPYNNCYRHGRMHIAGITAPKILNNVDLSEVKYQKYIKIYLNYLFWNFIFKLLSV